MIGGAITCTASMPSYATLPLVAALFIELTR